jgi:GNAT superfamily N-acetyltransferase
VRSSAAIATAPPRFRDTPRREDVAAIRRIIESTGYFRPDEIAVAIELAEDRLAKGLAASGYHFIFADSDTRAVGYACFGPIPCSLVSWDLYWIAVEDAWRGRGLGRDLLRRAEDAVRAAGGKAIYIETSSRPQYDATRAFYQACGYGLEHVFADFYAPGDGKAIYVKRF